MLKKKPGKRFKVGIESGLDKRQALGGKKGKIKTEGQPTLTQMQKANLKSEGTKEAQGMMLKTPAKGIKVGIERKS